MIKLRKYCELLLLFAVVSALINITPASAITEEEIIDFFLNTYNPNVNEIIPDLPLIKSVFGGQVIHIIVEKPGGNIELSAVTDQEGFITELESGEPDSPTLRLISNEVTLDRIRNSSDPVGETQDALISGDISYEGVGISMLVNVTIVKIAQFFASLLGII
jgi:hypothetical protein